MPRFSQPVALLFSGLLAVFSFPVRGQNLQEIGKKNSWKVGGGVSLTQMGYWVNGTTQRRDPYSYFLSGNIIPTLYGVALPFSFAVSNQSRSFQQPFNQFSLHPSYRWATAHLGYTTMTFSPYTLNGHIFRGVGVELRPEKFQVSAMYGQLRRAVAPDSVRNSVPAFERWGFGLKAGYRHEQDYAELSVFHGEDKAESLPAVTDETELFPEENMALGISLGKGLWQKLALQTEWALSALTRDTRSDKWPSTGGGWGGLFTPRLSTAYYQAWKAGLQYLMENYTAGVAYERIDPGYTTHGAYYFNNDLENYTVNATGTWWSGKINASANAGIQRDNLDRSKMSTMSRWVASLSISAAPTEKLTLSSTYSNFQSFTNIRSQFVDINQLTPYDNLDTLRFTQISQSLNLTANYQLPGSNQKRQFLSANVAVQDAAERQSDVVQNSGSRFYNLNTSYVISWVALQLNSSLAYNLNRNESQVMDVTTHGPSVSVSKTMMERKLRLAFSSAYNTSVASGESQFRILTLRSNAGYTIQKKHQFNLGLAAVNRAGGSGSEGTDAFTEFTGTLTYNYSF
ncbi:MAG: hypothetical protein ACOYXA_15890 [Bacteroidota bacterium]